MKIVIRTQKRDPKSKLPSNFALWSKQQIILTDASNLRKKSEKLMIKRTHVWLVKSNWFTFLATVIAWYAKYFILVVGVKTSLEKLILRLLL